MRYQRLFTEILARFKVLRPNLTSASRVGPQNWFNFSAGRAGFAFGWAMITGGRLRVERYIDVGDRDANKAYFDILRPFESNEELISWAASKMALMTDVLRPLVLALQSQGE